MEHENNNPIVTVIIPIYNAKDYLEAAFDSILSQTLTDWELFLVDDGSTDGTSEMCDIMASDDSRIHVIHQKNEGPAAARNAAIDKARGKYLYFMDADDWAVPEMLYDMVCLAENYLFDAWAGVPVDNAGRRLSSIGRRLYNPSEMKADTPEEQCAQLVVTGFYIETYYSDDDYYLQKQAVKSRVFADKFDFREQAHVLFDRNLLYTPWNKLYLASYIRERRIRFPKVHWDDFPFNLEVVRHVERVSVTDKAYYHFIRKRSDSESEKYNRGLFEKREEENEWLLGLYRNWKENYQKYLIEEMKKDPSLIPVIQEPAEQISESMADPSDEKTEERPPEQKEGTHNTGTDESAAQVQAMPAIPLPNVQIPSAAASEFIARRYLERLVGCVENITNEACELTKKEKKTEIKQMIHKESVRSALHAAKPGSSYMKLMLLPIRMKSVPLTYLEGLLISRVKKKHVKLFAKLKADR